MPSHIITPEDLQQFKLELLHDIRKLLSERQQPSTQRWLKSHQVIRILTVSPGTLQHMRESGILPFTEIGGVIYYDALDICFEQVFAIDSEITYAFPGTSNFGRAVWHGLSSQCFHVQIS